MSDSDMEFLNVDVILDSNESLKVIADDLGDSVSVMFIGKHNEIHRLSLELYPIFGSPEYGTPEYRTKRLVELLSNLSADAAAALSGCTKIDFNYGFGGTSGNLEVNLSSTSVASLTKLNASISTTIYTYS